VLVRILGMITRSKQWSARQSSGSVHGFFLFFFFFFSGWYLASTSLTTAAGWHVFLWWHYIAELERKVERIAHKYEVTQSTQCFTSYMPKHLVEKATKEMLALPLKPFSAKNVRMRLVKPADWCEFYILCCSLCWPPSLCALAYCWYAWSDCFWTTC